MNRAPWQSPRILYTLICVFLFGAVAGALSMRVVGKPDRHVSGSTRKESSRELSTQRTIQKFRQELGLTPDQAKEIEVVLDDFTMYIQTLQAQLDDVRATGRQRILRILREDQKEKFEKMMNEVQNKQLR